MSILDKLVSVIEQSPSGKIPFATYMQICLYDEQFGYYTGTREKIGKQGDFYTTSNIGTVMGESLANWIVNHYQENAQPNAELLLAEWGGGNGRLASHILDELQHVHPALYARTIYRSHEQSPYHRSLQMEQLAAHAERVTFDPVAPEQKHAIVWANELIDAFPVRRLRKTIDGVEEMFVRIKDGKLALVWEQIDAEPFVAWLAIAAVDQQFEVNEFISDWLKQVADSYPSCTLLVIDYGDELEELLASHRMNGTFVTYYNHQVADQPLAHPGEQDLTAHVNFTQVRALAEAEGFVTRGMMTQKQFLVETGILQRLQSHVGQDPFSPAAKRNRAIRQLLVSDQMSELFKVYIANRSST